MLDFAMLERIAGQDPLREREEPRCCAAGRCCGQVLAAWTVQQAYAVLRAALSQAAREELVTRNVAALVRVSVPRSTSRKVWTVEDARRFLESSRDKGSVPCTRLVE